MTLTWVAACGAGVMSGVLVLDDAVLVGTLDGTVHALRRADGAALWQTRLGRISITSLQQTHGETVLAAVGVRERGRGSLVALDRRDGTIAWRWNAAGTVNGPVAVVGSRVCAGSFFHGGGDVVAVEIGARRPAWRRTFDGWINGVRRDGDAVYAPCMNQRLYCLDAASGRTRWEFGAHGLVTALPLFHRDRIFFGAHDAVCYALDVDGRLVWRAEMADRMTGGMAAFDDLVIVGGWDGHVRALDAETGDERWAYDASAPIVATPLVHDGVVYIGTDGGQLVALDAVTGTLIDFFPGGIALEREIKSTPVADANMLYFGSLDGGVYAVRV